MVNSQAKTTVSSFTAKIPKTQVMPSNGKRTQVAFTTALKNITIFFRHKQYLHIFAQ